MKFSKLFRLLLTALVPALLMGECESALAYDLWNCKEWGVKGQYTDLQFISPEEFISNYQSYNSISAVCPMLRPPPIAVAENNFSVAIESQVYGDFWFVDNGVLHHQLPTVVTCSLISHDYSGRLLGTVTSSISGTLGQELSVKTMTLQLPASQLPARSSLVVQCELPPWTTIRRIRTSP